MVQVPHSDLQDRLLSYLQDHNVLTLATIGPTGPWASAVFYVSSGFDLYFLSSPNSRHGVNLASDPRVSATVQEDYSEWIDIKGIQMEGHVKRLDSVESAQARTLFAEKFPFTRLEQTASVIANAMNKAAWYRLQPSDLYFVDNARGFGHREKLTL